MLILFYAMRWSKYLSATGCNPDFVSMAHFILNIQCEISYRISRIAMYSIKGLTHSVSKNINYEICYWVNSLFRQNRRRFGNLTSLESFASSIVSFSSCWCLTEVAEAATLRLSQCTEDKS
jgi:hypothetical protein